MSHLLGDEVAGAVAIPALQPVEVVSAVSCIPEHEGLTAEEPDNPQPSGQRRLAVEAGDLGGAKAVVAERMFLHITGPLP
ncbi:hypothetical protein F9K91_07850 [Brucella tritici]|uniref:Uncharacterized protein n=1 Tax=Brucella tritici TaxID=94626 RepID=A0A833FPL9_9HYPH|nr:hypothetical protein [Brucella tritici]KAB2666035.1 hypothetical protein F9K91_07850 [Brucella tritici]